MGTQNVESAVLMKSVYSMMINTEKLSVLCATEQVKTIEGKLQSGEKERMRK